MPPAASSSVCLIIRRNLPTVILMLVSMNKQEEIASVEVFSRTRRRRHASHEITWVDFEVDRGGYRLLEEIDDPIHDRRHGRDERDEDQRREIRVLKTPFFHLAPPANATARSVIRRHFDCHLVTWQHVNVILSQSARESS